VYAHFVNKDALSRSAPGELKRPLRAPRHPGLGGILQTFAKVQQPHFFGPALITEAPHFFALAARRVFRLAWRGLRQLLAERMATGKIHQDAPLAAPWLLPMPKGLHVARRTLGIRRPSRNTPDAWAPDAVTLLQAYAPTASVVGARHHLNQKTRTMESP
jgi:hypothetical protein